MMPELPEVETVRRGLENAMAGQVIASVEIHRPDLRWPFPERMAERLSGVTVIRFRRVGKYILADLTSGETLIIHLGMSGGFRVCPPPGSDPQPAETGRGRHDHVQIALKNGVSVVYSDPRRFGMMDLAATDTVAKHSLIASLGPEPLGGLFNGAHLHNSLGDRRTPVKTALLNQRIVAGLGNIYACEALWRAGISPRRHTDRISAHRLHRLADCVRSVLRDAIAAGGSTLRDHRLPEGEFGLFQNSFSVYGREGEDCQREDCGGTVARIAQAGRSTFYCPACQK